MRRIWWVGLLALILLAACNAGAQGTATPAPAPTATPAPQVQPAVEVMDQEVKGGKVVVGRVVSEGPGWIVIHAEAEGKPGPILGYAPVAAGESRDVEVAIDASKATERVFAMLHVDAGKAGTFEFPGGPDAPVKVGEKVLVVPFELKMGMEGEGAAPTVTVAQSGTYGPYLVDAQGRALYVFLNDSPGKSACTGGCLQAWPPLRVEGEPAAGEGVDAGLLGTIVREDDGTTQVTYADWPLYYYAGDMGPGETNGQGRGGVWYLIAPDGTVIQKMEGGY